MPEPAPAAAPAASQPASPQPANDGASGLGQGAWPFAGPRPSSSS
jgi:hypothetical protein